jgi:hypothetical protein
MSSDDYRLEILSDAITKCDLPKPLKDMLADDLEYAQNIRNPEDQALQGIKRLVISGIRRELSTHERISEAHERIGQTQAAIAEACKLQQKACETKFQAAMTMGANGANKVMPVLAFYVSLLRPFRWPIAIICCSPFAADVLTRVIGALR